MVHWSWVSALAGAACTTAAAALLNLKPRPPAFHLLSLSVSSFNLHLPLLEADFVVTLHVTNPNASAIAYGPSVVSVLYDGLPLGSAKLEPGFQPPHSCKVVRLRAHLDSVELGSHALRFLADIARKEMLLDAAVEIGGVARVLWWDHRFSSLLHGSVAVDPAFLSAIELENQLGLDY